MSERCSSVSKLSGLRCELVENHMSRHENGNCRWFEHDAYGNLQTVTERPVSSQLGRIEQGLAQLNATLLLSGGVMSKLDTLAENDGKLLAALNEQGEKIDAMNAAADERIKWFNGMVKQLNEAAAVDPFAALAKQLNALEGQIKGLGDRLADEIRLLRETQKKLNFDAWLAGAQRPAPRKAPAKRRSGKGRKK